MKKILVGIISGIIIIFSLMIITLNFVGFKTFRVISDSMAPKIYKNSLVIVRLYNADINLEKEDIIAFNVNGKLVLHRIVDINNDQIITKGDANNSNDSPISYNDVIGIYAFSIPIIGILFISIYPWLILVLITISYILIKEIKKELKKKNE